MSKRTVFTTVTPLPEGISRETVMETLHNHKQMLDLNPLIEERHPIKPPSTATPEEYHCQWYSLTDRVHYLPGGLISGRVTYTACFHDLINGVQTHVYAPLGLKVKGKWTLGGSLAGEPIAPVELGIGTPITGLWLREDVDMRCNFVMTSFVKATLKRAHGTLVDRLMVKAQVTKASIGSQRPSQQTYDPQPSVTYSSTNSSEQKPSNTKTVSQDKDYGGPPLHPKPLSTWNSGSMFNGLTTESNHTDRASHRDPVSTAEEVSWQGLNRGVRTASLYHNPTAQSDIHRPPSHHGGGLAEGHRTQHQLRGEPAQAYLRGIESLPNTQAHELA